MAKFGKYARPSYAPEPLQTPPTHGYPPRAPFPAGKLRSRAPRTSGCPAYADGRPQACATGAGGRGWLPLPRPPQTPHGCLSGLRGLGA
jgi:hypothetical protein